MQYPDQKPEDKWMLIAMEPYTDSAGDKFVFHLTHILKKGRDLSVNPFDWKGNPGFVDFEKHRVVFLNHN